MLRLVVLAAVLLAAPLAAAEDDPRSLLDWVADTAATNRLRLEYDGDGFSGPAWNRLLSEGRRAQFFLLGEEHGIAENATLAAQLFIELTDAGYSKFLIEISPPMAEVLDAADAAQTPAPVAVHHSDKMQVPRGSLYPESRALEIHCDDCINHGRLFRTILL